MKRHEKSFSKAELLKGIFFLEFSLGRKMRKIELKQRRTKRSKQISFGIFIFKIKHEGEGVDSRAYWPSRQF